MSDSVTAAQRVGRQVRAALVEQGRTQAEIATALGMTRAALTRRATGHVSFRADELIAIADYLSVDPARFLQPIPTPPSRSESQQAASARGAA